MSKPKTAPPPPHLRALEIRAGTFVVRELYRRSRMIWSNPLPTEEEIAQAVLEAADQVQAGTWVDPDPLRRLTDAQVQDWIDKARVRANALRMGDTREDVKAYHALHNLIIDAEIMLRKSMARRRASSVEDDIIADMERRGVKP